MKDLFLLFLVSCDKFASVKAKKCFFMFTVRSKKK